jgi:hypothetical protein
MCERVLALLPDFKQSGIALAQSTMTRFQFSLELYQFVLIRPLVFTGGPLLQCYESRKHSFN